MIKAVWDEIHKKGSGLATPSYEINPFESEMRIILKIAGETPALLC